MRNLSKLLMLLLVFAFTFSCDNNTLIDDSEDLLTGGAIVGGLVKVGNPLLTYVVGAGKTYSAAGSIQQARVATTSLDIYKSFTNSVTGSSTNRVKLTSVSISDTKPGDIAAFAFSFTYEELISGLTLDGSSLPADDSNLNIGDFWTLEYEATTSAGDIVNNANVTKVAVGTRYAGVYDTVESAYWNTGNLLGNWNGTERIVESIDAVVYRHAGLAYWDDNEFFFSVNNDTGYITASDEDLEGNGLLLNGSPAMVCNGDYSFVSLTCDATTSKATPDDVNGKDQLEFTIGYWRATGTREFYEKLVRK